MRQYKEVPELWYFSVLVVSIGVGAAGVGAWPTSTTPAVVLYGVFLAMIFCIPSASRLPAACVIALTCYFAVGIMCVRSRRAWALVVLTCNPRYSTTNVSITLNVLAEFIGGAWFEGNALAMNFFKSYGYVTTAHTVRISRVA